MHSAAHHPRSHSRQHCSGTDRHHTTGAPSHTAGLHIPPQDKPRFAPRFRFPLLHRHQTGGGHRDQKKLKMCGRARCSLAPDELATATSVPREQWRDMDRYKPSYNASPGAYMPILAPAAAGGGQLELRAMRCARWRRRGCMMTLVRV